MSAIALSVSAAPPAGRRRRRWPIALATLLGLAVLLHMILLAIFRFGLLAGPAAVPMPAVGPTHGVAILYVSGDAGFSHGAGPRIAERLVQHGYPVLGIDSARFFAVPRTPAEIAAWVAHGARATLAWSGQPRLVVIGQSFGSDNVPTALVRLPAPLRRRIALTALVVPGRDVYRRVSLGEYLGWSAPDAEGLPPARLLAGTNLLCIGGAAEPDSICPALAHQAGARTVMLPGDHYLDHDYDRIAATILHSLAAIPGTG